MSIAKTKASIRTAGIATILFVITALVFGLLFAKAVPPLWNLDESAHFGRAYQISEGHLTSQKLPGSNYGGYVPTGVVSLDSAAHQDLSAVAQDPVINRQDFKHQALQKAIARRPINAPQKEAFHFPGSAAYSPIAYIAPAAGIGVCRLADCSLGNTVLIARIFGLAAYICVVAFAIWLLRAKKIKWIIFAVGLLPMTIFQAAAVSADGPVIGLSLLLFAVLIKALGDKRLSGPLIILLALLAICIPLIKVNYGFLDLAIIPVAMTIYKDRKKALSYTSILIVLTVFLALGWLHIARGPSKAISTLQAPNPVTHSLVSVRGQSDFLLHNPIKFTQVLARTGALNESYWIYTGTGEFALNAVQMPLNAVVLACLTIVCSAFYANSELARYRKQAVVLGLVSVLAALSIFGALYITFTPVRDLSISGVQGRYFIPLIPFFLAAVAAVIPVKVLMSPKTAAILFSTSTSVILLSGFIYYVLATY